VKQAEAALDDDLNAPVALAALGAIATMGHELADLANKRKKDPAFVGAAGIAAQKLVAAMMRVASQIGLLNVRPEVYARRTKDRRLALRSLSGSAVDEKVRERTQARAAKDYAKSDSIRDELAALGISLHDGPGGTEWTVAP
jgi:cysteinyl-tRNA synthetase